MNVQNSRVAVIGLGYVGLPLAVEFGKKIPTIGYDINFSRVKELNGGYDHTLEISSKELEESVLLSFTDKLHDIADANVYIVTVPTPVDQYNQPDLFALLSASESIGKVIKKGDVVIYESTVYPGATEEDCIPVIEKVSGLVCNRDFFAGYSPERINPGDKKHRIVNIKKITSGSTCDTAEYVDQLYRLIIVAGTHKAETIKVAEAAKVIENTQRDLNIALINELAIIFNKMDIDTEAVLNAAGTKWNFLPFRPGLVGGHCIGVDPYYLTHKAQSLGYHPEIILAGRRINDGMGRYVVSQLVKALIKKRIQVDGSRVLLLGFAFKENCPDLRNTRVVDIFSELIEYNISVDVYDPWASEKEALQEYDISLIEKPKKNNYDAVVLTVAHQQFFDMGVESIRALGKAKHVLYDLKYLFPSTATDLRL